MRKFYSEATLQMIKLEKKVIELENQSAKKDDGITSNKDKNKSARKVERDIKRKNQHGSGQQGSLNE